MRSDMHGIVSSLMMLMAGCCIAMERPSKTESSCLLQHGQFPIRIAALQEIDPKTELPIMLASASCASGDQFACMGNGECRSGECKCEPGWSGPTCSRLDLLPLSKSAPGLRQGNGVPPSWGAATVYHGQKWYIFAGVKTDTSTGASDLFAQNSGLMLFRANDLGGPYENLGELKGLNGQSFGFRVDLKKHPIDGSLLLLTEGYSHPEGFGFIFLRSASGSPEGPWTEHLLYRLGRKVKGQQEWTADASNTDDDRWDCRMADPTFVILADGTVYVGYRGTKCCCDDIIGAWGNAGEHEYETAGLLHAESWDGTFERAGVKIFGENTDNEDMYMWTSSKGVHMLMHSQNNDHFNHDRRGAYAFSPDGKPDNWRLSTEEAWQTHLPYDTCESDFIMKRQRPSLVFDPDTDKPTHLLTGVATAHHGLQWGDGWTAFQPIRTPTAGHSSCGGESQCCSTECSAGSIGSASGCKVCQPQDVSADCEAATSSAARNECICIKCKGGKLGHHCEYAPNVQSTTCHVDGYKLLPGTSNGEVFRCGMVYGDPPQAGGWFGNCIPAGGECSGTNNCQDGSDEAVPHCATSDFQAICPWPFVRQVGQECLECNHEDIPHCVAGQASPMGSHGAWSCVCNKCEPGYLGPQCSVTDVTPVTTTAAATTTTLAPKTTVKPPTASQMRWYAGKRCKGAPVHIPTSNGARGGTWGGLGVKVTKSQCKDLCLAQDLCIFAVCRLDTTDSTLCDQCSAYSPHCAKVNHKRSFRTWKKK